MKRWTPEEINFLKENKHLKLTEIAAALGRTIHSIESKRLDNGILPYSSQHEPIHIQVAPVERPVSFSPGLNAIISQANKIEDKIDSILKTFFNAN